MNSGICRFHIEPLLQQCSDHQHTYQIFFCDETEDEAVDGSKLVLSINHVKHGQHPFYEKNLRIGHTGQHKHWVTKSLKEAGQPNIWNTV